jgi:hypothetical protein
VTSGHGPHPSGFDEPGKELGKDALLPGQTATWANYTGYEKGINGIMVDVAGAHAPPTRADFEFHVGNDDYPAGWGPAPNPVEFSVRPGQGAGNSDRVTITWEDRAIKNTWLQVRVKAERLGLRQDDVFYFGNAPGETGDSADNAIVNTTDELLARSHTRGPRHPAAVDDPYDHNRDGLVNATDRIIARDHRTGPGDALRLITAPGSLGGGAEGVAAADPVEPDVRAAPPAAAVHDRVLQRAAGGETGRRNTPPGKLAWLADFEWIGHPQRHAKKRPSVQQDVDKLVAGDGP